MYIIFIVFPSTPPQNPGQNPGQKSDQKPEQKSGQKIIRQIGRTLSEKQCENLQKTSLKLLQKNSKSQINQSVWFPFCRGELKGLSFYRFNLFFGQCSVIFWTKFRGKIIENPSDLKWIAGWMCFKMAYEKKLRSHWNSPCLFDR